MHACNGLLAAAVFAAGIAIGNAATAQSTTHPSLISSSASTTAADQRNAATSNAISPSTVPSYSLPPALPTLPTDSASTAPTQEQPVLPAPAAPIAPSVASTTQPGTGATVLGATTLPATTFPIVPESAPTAAGTTTQPGKLRNVVITSDLDQARDQIAPSLGATTYTLGPSQIQSTPGGENATFQQVLLRAPSVVMDSFGQEHVRGEHANLTYRVNGVILPEGLNGFGQELDTRLINSVTLIDGSLPAQFGFHTAGIVDVTTKEGASLNHNEVSLYGGGYNTFQPSLQLGGTSGKWDYFATASYKHNDIGIENPTSSYRAIHDTTSQERFFGYFSYHIDDISRLSLLVNTSDADFQIPNTPDQTPAFTLAGQTPSNSSQINENQSEHDYYTVISYQKTVDQFSLQASAFSRYGQIQFQPDPVGDLIFQGVAGEVFNTFLTNGVQFDGSYVLDKQHTIRAGFLGDYTAEHLNTNTLVFPVDPVTGNQSSDVPIDLQDDSGNRAMTSGIYLQDEWKLNKVLTLNYGLRYDRFDSNFDNEDQVSPRVNIVWKINDPTTFHVGYARYFTPPPLQNLNQGTVEKAAGTTHAPENFLTDPAKVERADYFDAGISRQISKPLQVNVDGFYKYARNLLDLGQFGQAFILSPFNYRVGTVYGADIGSTYKEGGFSAFGNFAWIVTNARDIDSQQFQIGNDELAYIQTHDIHLDHDSEFTASAGVSYTWTDDSVYLDVLYGSGLRTGFANTSTEPPYYPINLGYEHVFHPNGGNKDLVKLRFDVINVFDETYQIRNGTGIGVNASQFGQRRTFLLGLAYDF